MAGSRYRRWEILKIVDYQGKTVYEYQPPAGEQVLRPEHAFLMESILSDSAARIPTFGANSILNLPFQAAVKTGTSNDSRDNWTLGFTPDLAVGVWVGNADYTPMENTTGVTGAGPIWAQFMTYGVNLVTGGHPTSFVIPRGIEQRTICTVSGTQPSQWCPTQREEYFAADQLPLPPENDLWRKVQLDTWTDLEASPECTSDFTDEVMAINVTEEWQKIGSGRSHKASNGPRIWASVMPSLFPTGNVMPAIHAHICSLQDWGTGKPLHRIQSISALWPMPPADSQLWRLEWGTDPGNLTIFSGDVATPIPSPTKVYTWNLTGMPDGQVTLRLYMKGSGNSYADKNIRLNLVLPTPTATPTSTSTPTPTPTLIPTKTPTPQPLPTDTPTVPPVPTETPTETVTPGLSSLL